MVSETGLDDDSAWVSTNRAKSHVKNSLPVEFPLRPFVNNGNFNKQPSFLSDLVSASHPLNIYTT